MGAGRPTIPLALEEHDPARGLAAAAVLVLCRARTAGPVLPPDPLEVVHLEHEERDDPQQNLPARHAGTVGDDRPNGNGPGGLFRPAVVLSRMGDTGRSGLGGAAPPARSVAATNVARRRRRGRP